MKPTNIVPEHSAIVLIDVQQRLAPAMNDMAPVLKKIHMLLEGGHLLDADVVVTEQYPRGLGRTVEYLAPCLDSIHAQTIEKTAFSCFAEPTFCTRLSTRKPKTLVLCGIETHVCVLQTARDGLARGFDVVLAVDAVTSRADTDRQAAVDFMRDIGVQVRTVESILFDWMRDSRHPQFKQIGNLVR